MRAIIRLAMLLVLTALSLTTVFAIGEEDEGSPLEGQCVLYMSEYNAMIYDVDNDTSSLIQEEVLAYEIVGEHLLIVQPAEGGFLVSHNDWLIPFPGERFLGAAMNEEGEILVSAMSSDGEAFVYSHGDGEDVTSVAQGILPTWGPDGEFATTILGIGLTFYTDADVIPTDPFGLLADWSPNGEYIIYTASDGSLRLMDADYQPVPLEWDTNLSSWRPVWIDDETILLSIRNLETEGKLGLYLFHPFEDAEPELLLAEDGSDLHDAFVIPCPVAQPANADA